MKAWITAYVLLASFALLPTLFAQAQAILEFNGLRLPARVQEYPISAEMGELALKDRIKAMGYTYREKRGYYFVEKVVRPEIGQNEPLDYLMKVDKSGTKKEPACKVYIATGKPGIITFDNLSKEEASTRNAALAGTAAIGAAAVLSGMDTHVEDQKYLKEIADQEELVKQEQRRLNDLMKDQEYMEKKIKDLQKDLDDNAKEQERQRKKLEEERTKLDTKKASRVVEGLKKN